MGTSERWALLVPAHWWSIPLLRPEDATRRVRQLVKASFAGVDNAPKLRRDLERDLLEQASEARRGGGTRLIIAPELVPGVPIAGDVIVGLAEGVPGDVHDLAEAFLAEGYRAEVLQMSAGWAVRRERLAAQDAGPGVSLAGLTVAYHLVDPEGAGVHSVTLHASLPESAIDPIRDIFDAVGQSFHYVGQQKQRVAQGRAHGQA